MIDYKNELKEIAEHYGFENQSNMLIEEMAELIQAINKYKRVHRGQPTQEEWLHAKFNIVEEMADVIVMLKQIQYLLNIHDYELTYEKGKKIKRTLEFIHKSEKAGSDNSNDDR